MIMEFQIPIVSLQYTAKIIIALQTSDIPNTALSVYFFGTMCVDTGLEPIIVLTDVRVTGIL